MNFTTPALLFPAISLLLLAYTNRFLAIASLVRNLHRQYRDNPEKSLVSQIHSLRKRLVIIRNMQVFGTLSLLLCVFAMFVIFAEWILLGKYLFGISLVLMIFSLTLSMWELFISVHAVNIELQDLEDKKIKNNMTK